MLKNSLNIKRKSFYFKKHQSKYLFGLIAAFTVVFLLVLSSGNFSPIDFRYDF